MNIRNFRDIGGYKTRDGKVMKRNRIFRGGALDRITKEEADYLEHTLLIRHILDFRDEKEADLAKDYSFSGVCYERIGALNVQEHDEDGFDFEKILGKEAGSGTDWIQDILTYLKEGYKKMAFANPAYQRLFDLLLQDDGNLYFHCTAGKDRTGVAGFLIMMALGVEEEDAIQEYLLSNTYLKQGDDEFAMLLNSSEEKKQLFAPLLGVQEEFIRLTIRSIKEAYTSYDEFFLREYKLDQEKRNRLAELYCE